MFLIASLVLQSRMLPISVPRPGIPVVKCTAAKILLASLVLAFKYAVQVFRRQWPDLANGIPEKEEAQAWRDKALYS
jgi:hypothetical protein